MQVECVFADDHMEESCVFIYHELNSTTLQVKVYNSSTQFPQLLIDANPDNYSIAVFKMTGRKIEADPLEIFPSGDKLANRLNIMIDTTWLLM